MNALSIMIKPASGNCNLRCKYCFYHDLANKRDIINYGMMSEQTLKIIVQKAFATKAKTIYFAFQGGEPTLRGLPFFRKFASFINQYNQEQIPVQLALQTNGLLIDQEWTRFFKENHFLIGISLDGPKDIHDLNRLNPQMKSTFNQILKSIDLFNQAPVAYNILTVVTKSVARHATRVYNFFKKHNFKFLQFIPCLDQLGQPQGTHAYSLTAQDYEKFLKTLFDLWYRDLRQGKKISIRMFDNILNLLLGYPAESCDQIGYCSIIPTIESDGSVYPCDFYVLDQWKLGNINQSDFKTMISSAKAEQFRATSRVLPESCRQCNFYQVCRSGCRRHKEAAAMTNYFCSAYQNFYTYSLPRFSQLAQQLSYSPSYPSR